eukprot:1402012-Alexandrium_andersonii.AAC.1
MPEGALFLEGLGLASVRAPTQRCWAQWAPRNAWLRGQPPFSGQAGTSASSRSLSPTWPHF